MINSSSYLLFSILLLLIFPSQLSMQDGDWTKLTGIGISIFTTISLILILSKRKFSIDLNKKIIFIFVGLIFSSLLSFLVIGKFKPIYVYGSLILLFLCVRIISSNLINIDKFFIRIAIGSSLLGLIIIILGLDEPFLGSSSFSFHRFSGFFDNPNAMGIFSAGLIHIILGTLYTHYQKINWLNKFFFIIILILNTAFLLSSNSRAALLSVLIVLAAISFIEIRNSFNFSKFKIYFLKKNLKKSLSILFIILICLSTMYYQGFFDKTLVKFFTKRGRDVVDFSDGRIQSWLFAINNWTWFGHKNFNEFAYNSGLKVYGHSTWLQHLTYYGLLAALFFWAWILLMLHWSWSQIKKNSNNAKILFFVLLGYSVIATFEESTSTPGLITSIFMFSILHNRIIYR